jgi:hypothetical protein
VKRAALALASSVWLGLALACGPQREPAYLTPSTHALSVVDAPAPAPTPALDAPKPHESKPCAADKECFFDASRRVCDSDARYFAEPQLTDQGVICLCEERACSTLVIHPIPCESDDSCAVDPSPRPHPVPASPAHPHEKGRRCVDYRFSTTCERTNICTMHRLVCP